MPCRFPGRKEENWWLVVGQPEINVCHTIKRLALKQSAVNKLKVQAPSQPGKCELKLMFISDSYVGVDQVRLLFLKATYALQAMQGHHSSG